VEEERGRTMTREPRVEKRVSWKASLKGERMQLVMSFAMIALVGLNDSATGANVRPCLYGGIGRMLISRPQLDSMQEFYNVSYDQISLVFLSNVAGSVSLP
jgi:hypothetical protein